MKAPLQAPKSFGSAASSAPAQRKGGLKAIVDNRPSAIAQRKLQGVIQGKGERVWGTAQRKRMDINESIALGGEASMMGNGALQLRIKGNNPFLEGPQCTDNQASGPVSMDSTPNSKKVIQGYFTYNGTRLIAAQAEKVDGWAHVHLQGITRAGFLDALNDDGNAFVIQNWLNSNGQVFNANMLDHPTRYVMDELNQRKRDMFFTIEMLYQDSYQSEIEGIDRFKQDVSNVDVTQSTAFSFLQGYEFQLKQIIQAAQQSTYAEVDGMDVLQERVNQVEAPYTDHNGVNRRADIRLNEPGGNTSYIEVKGVASDSNANQAVRDTFQRQAIAYAHSGTPTLYIFKNQPPDWMRVILNQNRLGFRVA